MARSGVAVFIAAVWLPLVACSSGGAGGDGSAADGLAAGDGGARTDTGGAAPADAGRDGPRDDGPASADDGMTPRPDGDSGGGLADATAVADGAAADAADAADGPACQPACDDRRCGDDGCGGSCGTCAAPSRCEAGRCTVPRVVLNEVLASNGDALEDEDGDSSDWIELYNREELPVSLEGWYLTDNAENRTKWRLPGVTLGSHAFLVVFASGKDRAGAGGELHTDFRLTDQGEYLALVMPDGETVASEYAPALPQQYRDVSYGVAQTVAETPLVAPGAAARFLVPRDGALGETWTRPEFDDAAWAEGPTGLGWERAGAPNPLDAADLAEGRDTTQSSELAPYGSGRAVDTDGQTFTHTAEDDRAPFWEVDLGGTVWLSAVELHNRQDCCLSRLRDVTVRVLDEGGAEVWASETVNPGNERFGRELANGPFRWDIDLYGLDGALGGVLGRRVRVTRAPDPELYGTSGQGGAGDVAVLSLAEVLVRGGESGVFQYVATDVSDGMLGEASSLYVRVPFDVADRDAVEFLTLVVRHDAGFVAWLNGMRVAARNAPEPLGWDAAATEENAGVLAAETVDLTPLRGLLRPGPNVLAIQALNGAADDGDLLVLPELVAKRVEDGGPSWFREPTPGALNETTATAGYVVPPVADPPHGFHDAPFLATLTSATPGATIRYTLDATVPSETNGVDYAGPIAIGRTTVLRAVALRPGAAPSSVTTVTWLFLDDVVAQTRDAVLARGFPESWGAVAADYEMDPRVVSQAATLRDDLRALPTLSLVAPTAELFGPDGIYTRSTERGDAWERAASLELLDPTAAMDTGDGPLQVDCGVRVQGGAFRRMDVTKKHSLRLLFKAAYGPTKLRWPLFGPDAADRFDTLTLRAFNCDGWQWAGAGAQATYVRDTFSRETALAMGAPASHATSFHLYINGVYWGIYEATERPDHSFSASYLGGDKDDWDSISNGAATSGDMEAWNTLLELARGGLVDDAAYRHVQGLAPDGTRDETRIPYVDVDNLIDYMIINLYVGNTDWPHHNYWVGRPRDGRFGFQFYLWDTEWSLGLRSNLDTNQIGVDRGVAVPWWAIKENPEFRLRFADRVQRVFFHGGPLSVDAASPDGNVPARRFAALASRLERALVAESARWGDQHASQPYTVAGHWRPEVDRVLRDYFPYRTARVLDHFRAAGLYPTVPPPALRPFGGIVAPGATVEVEAPQGTVHYTLDGSDPRLYGGALSPTALGGGALESFTVPATPGALVVRARARLDGEWSALEEVTLLVAP